MLYIICKIGNPTFLPDVFITTAVINFTVTEEGLEEQLLAAVVRKEMPEVEQTREELVLGIAQDRAILDECENSILRLLSNSKGMILDDIELIENLKLSKRTASEVNKNLAEAEIKQQQVSEARASYQAVAARSSLLYFLINDLSQIDPMYQFSLAYFSKLFNNIIDLTPPS
jgi:dynein heavy chain